MRDRSLTWSDAERSLTTEYTCVWRPRAARWRARREDRSRPGSANEIDVLVDRAATTSSVSRANLVVTTSLLEIVVISTGISFGFPEGSIPDHVVGAPLKPSRRPQPGQPIPPIPDHVVGAPLKLGLRR